MSSRHREMVVATILVEWVWLNRTPTSHEIPHNTTLKMHQPTKLCQLRFCICLSPTLQHWTLTMQTLSGKYSLVWLTIQSTIAREYSNTSRRSTGCPTILLHLGAFWGLLLLSCWRLQTQGTPQAIHRCEANNPTTVRDVFLQAIC